jgi:4-deoxy-L-threo-5-hexosulose-uronate ketol-isomerase
VERAGDGTRARGGARIPEYFNERRETGVINIGAAGRVGGMDPSTPLGHANASISAWGAREIRFQSGEGETSVYYLLSCPAHRQFPTKLVTHAAATIVQTGDLRNAPKRRIVRYIREHSVQNCQLVMGYTELAEGSVWNTRPAHTHARRSELYL